jgi:hypothetical protein
MSQCRTSRLVGGTDKEHLFLAKGVRDAAKRRISLLRSIYSQKVGIKCRHLTLTFEGIFLLRESEREFVRRPLDVNVRYRILLDACLSR